MNRSLATILLTALLASSLGVSGTTCNPGGSLPGGATGGSGTGTGTGGGSSGSVSATNLEQLSLERINRARLKPGAEATSFGIAVDEGIPGQINTNPKQPVAMNAALSTAADGHSQDMINNNYFEHNTPAGVTPFQRMNNAGYAFQTAGENLAFAGTTPGGPLDEVATVEDQHQKLFVDAGIAGRGHRVTMLNGDFREVGIGIARGNSTQQGQTLDTLMQTQDYGTASSTGTFVLGVVYNDANSNGQYDAGEGTASASVTLDGSTTTTNAAGGYSFEVTQPATYTLRFDAGHSQAVTINSGSPNIKVDFVSGTTVVVNLGLGPLP